MIDEGYFEYLEELRPNKPSRIFNIYIRKNGGGNFRLWCEFDDSYECWHVQAAWTYPQVQKMMTQYKGKVKVCPVCGWIPLWNTLERYYLETEPGRCLNDR